MTRQTTETPIDLIYMSEGTAQESDGMDEMPTVASPMPPVIDAQRHERAVNFAAETGLIAAVHISAEGKDNDDAQDAALKSGETTSDTAAQPDAASATETSKASKPTVLIVEDTTELAEVIQATLVRMNLNVHHETHGSKVIEKFDALDPDVVLLDISLPDTTGWKIMDKIKERLEQTQGNMPKVIVITAYDDPANRLIGKLQGVLNYLIKPFTTDEIERLVKQALEADNTKTEAAQPVPNPDDKAVDASPTADAPGAAGVTATTDAATAAGDQPKAETPAAAPAESATDEADKATPDKQES